MPGRKPPVHPITSASSVARLYWVAARNPPFRRIYLRMIGNIFRTYFRPQFFRPRGHSRIALDMELDALVPFDPTWLPCYLGFVRLWAGSLGWLHLRFGDRALPEMEGFVTGMESLFLEARKIFSQCDSTMASRPGPRASLDSLLIHLSDRNSFCFPSLHVMIVKYNAVRMAASLDRLAGPGEDFSAEKAFLEERALRIVESIVHVKQHSFSDIPAGLFLLRTLKAAEPVNAAPDGGANGWEEDLRFLDRLFLDSDGRSRAFMIALYHRLHQLRKADPRGGDPQWALLDFLRDYEREVGAILQKPAGAFPASASQAAPNPARQGESRPGQTCQHRNDQKHEAGGE